MFEKLFKSYTKGTGRKFTKLKRDLKSGQGLFADAVKDAAKDTAKYTAKEVFRDYFKKRDGIFKRAIELGFVVNFPYEVSFPDEGKLDSYIRRYGDNNKKKSIHNPRKYIPYWRFLTFGWGKKGGYRKDRYEVFIKVMDRETGETFITSPFNRKVRRSKQYQVLFVARHPGREAANWITELQSDYVQYFYQVLDTNISAVVESYNL